MIDHAIKEIKPDVYLGIEDIWAFQGFYNKPWWDKINSMVWTTLDSLPILTEASIFRGRIVDDTGTPIPHATIRTDCGSDGLDEYQWLTRLPLLGPRADWER